MRVLLTASRHETNLRNAGVSAACEGILGTSDQASHLTWGVNVIAIITV